MHARGLRVAGFGPGFVAHPPARGLARLMAARRSAAAMSKASVKAAAQADAGQSSPLLRLNLQAIQDAMEHLKRVDERLVPVIDHFGATSAAEKLIPTAPTEGTSVPRSFVSLARSICAQQLSMKAATTIFLRVCDACAPELTPNTVLRLPDDTLRACGLSARKLSYLRDLASRYESGGLSDAAIWGMSDEELVEALLKVKGIGVWTCHMHQIFALGRPDVLPVGDLGVRKGIMQLYGLKALPSPGEMERITAPWRPYRSVGSYLMWQINSDKWAEVMGFLNASVKAGVGAKKKGRKAAAGGDQAVGVATATVATVAEGADGAVVVEEAAAVAVKSRGKRGATTVTAVAVAESEAPVVRRRRAARGASGGGADE